MKSNITIFDVIRINANYNALEAVKINGKPYGKTVETTEAHYFIVAEANTTVKQIKALKCKNLIEAYSGYTAALIGFAKAIAEYKNHVEAKFSAVEFVPAAKVEEAEAAEEAAKEAAEAAKSEAVKAASAAKAEAVKAAEEAEKTAKEAAEKIKTKTKKEEAVKAAEAAKTEAVEAAERFEAVKAAEAEVVFEKAVEAAEKAKSEALEKIKTEAAKAAVEAETDDKKKIASVVLEAFRNVLFTIGFGKKERVAVMFDAMKPKDQRLNTFEAASTLVAIFAEVFTKTADNGNKKQETFSVISVRSDGTENISNTVRNAFEVKLIKLYNNNYTSVINKTDFDILAKAQKAKIAEAKAAAEAEKAKAAEEAEAKRLLEEAKEKAETEAKEEAEKEIAEALETAEAVKPETKPENK